VGLPRHKLKGNDMHLDTNEYGTVVYDDDLDKHEGHFLQETDTVFDNPIEYTTWGVCSTCHTDVVLSSATILELKGEWS
jgi:hypothetical protein